MKWLMACLLALVMVAPALAGEDPFVAVVGNDIDADTNSFSADPLSVGFYLSPKYAQFLYDQDVIGVPVTGETFLSIPAVKDQPEICDENGIVDNFELGEFTFRGNPNVVVRAGDAGRFEWNIRLPKKPNAINICIQCGVLKPNTFTRFTGFDAINTCAAYTGERLGDGWCTRQDVNPGVNPVRAGTLPQITAVAYPGPNNFNTTNSGGSALPFYLTAYRNPGTYNNFPTIPITGPIPALRDNAALQVLAGNAGIPLPLGSITPAPTDDPGTRVMLKSCFDKCINIKLPVTGQRNSLGQQEFDLEFGDLIRVVMSIPRSNVVDIYCQEESARLLGIGEAHW